MSSFALLAEDSKFASVSLNHLVGVHTYPNFVLELYVICDRPWPLSHASLVMLFISIHTALIFIAVDAATQANSHPLIAIIGFA